jgi:hypothetical protein
VTPKVQQLLVRQASVDYHGFFASPAFNLMGEGAKIMAGLSDTFASHNIGLTNFRTEADISDPAANAVVVNLGRFGIYRFKFDQVQASLRGFDNDDLEGLISVIQKGDAWLHSAIDGFAFRNHVFVYASHSALSESTSESFLLSLPRRPTPAVIGKDLGSGIIETWFEGDMGAKVHFTMSHSLIESDGIYIHYMVLFDRKEINYVEEATKARVLLDRILQGLGLEFGEEGGES